MVKLISASVVTDKSLEQLLQQKYNRVVADVSTHINKLKLKVCIVMKFNYQVQIPTNDENNTSIISIYRM